VPCGRRGTLLRRTSVHLTEVARAVLERLAYLQRLKSAALARFGPGVPSDRLRASEVAAAVALALDVNDSAIFRRDLNLALYGAGWRSVNTANRRSWKGMRRL